MSHHIEEINGRPTMRVSVSQLKKFKECPRRWRLRYARGLKPVYEERTEALTKGSAIHLGLEALHGGKSIEEALKLAQNESNVEELLFDGFQIANTGQTDTIERAWIRAVIRAYASYEKVRIDDAIGVISDPEYGFGFSDPDLNTYQGEVILGEVGGVTIVLCGKVDGWDEPSGVAFEHKTVKSMRSVKAEDLSIDDQVSAMLFAMTQIRGEPCLRMVYNLIEKPGLKYQPKTPKDLRNETLGQYEYRIAQHMLKSSSRYFQRIPITRTSNQLEQWRQDALSVVHAIIGGVSYPALRASWNGPCAFCPFRRACDNWHKPSVAERILTTEFTTPAERQAEREKKEQMDG